MTSRAIRGGWLGILVWLASSGLAAKEGYLLWSIGQKDHSYAEFAIAGRFNDYAADFPQDVSFTVGQSDPARDWPYIQPGPADAWAGNRPHPFRIEFTLDQPVTGDARLTVDFVNTHYGQPPVLSIDINGNVREFLLPAGAGDAALSDPAQGWEYTVLLPFAGSLLQARLNVITLTLTEGSWVLYDAVKLEGGLPPPTDADIRGLEALPTMFFAREGEAVRQVVQVAIDNFGREKSGHLTATLNGQTWTRELPAIGFGRTLHAFLVQEVTGPTSARFTLTVGEQSFTTEALLAPQRKWKVFVSPHIHTDIGYTAVQPEVIALHERNLDDAVEACERLPDFTWNCEVAWQAQVYLRDRPPEQGQKLLALMRQGRIGLHGSYLNMLTGLCSHEELNRLAYFAKGLQRDHGVPVAAATITDVPSCVGTLPLVLARSGIRCWAQGINGYRGPFFDAAEVKSPFWWEGPDGSKVLAWFTPGYAQIGSTGLLENVRRVETALPHLLRAYDRPDYPYDAILVYGAFGDNARIDTRFGETAAEWNAKWAYPQIILCRDEQFFDYIAARFSDQIPIFKGDPGGWWEDGAASSAAETALNRRTHEALTTAEKLHTVAAWLNSPRGEGYPAEALRAAWDDVLWYDEHTWGAWHSISQPDHPDTAAQWKYKAEPAYRAAKAVEQWVQEGLRDLAASVSPGEGPSVLVFNPLSWARTDLVRVTIPKALFPDRAAKVVDRETGQGQPFQTVARSDEAVEIAFLAEGVPSLGYRVYEIQPAPLPLAAGEGGEGEGSPPVAPLQGQVAENRFFRLVLDPVTGGLTSLFDKRSNRELLDPTSPYKANQYLYATGGAGTQAIHKNPNLPPANFTYHSPESVQIASGTSAGPLFSSVIVRGQTTNTPRLESEIVLYDALPRIDFINRLTKDPTYDKEAVYFAFPLAATAPEFAYEIPDGIVRPATDMLKGACLDWFCVQHWVDVSDATGGVTWATPDTPLICLGDLTVGKWLTEFRPASGSVFAYAMNNYWDTNYKAGQGGDFTFRYALTSHAGGFDPVAAARFGWEVANPLLTTTVPPLPRGEPGGGNQTTVSFCTVDAPNVLVLTLKRAEDGDGWIVRLWEMAGRAGTAQLSFPQWQPQEAMLTNLVEENQQPLGMKGRSVSVPVEAWGVMTVRVK